MTFKSTLLVMIAALAVTTLAACGVSGPLEKAAPLFGADRVAYEAERAKQEAEAKKKADDRAAREAARKAPMPDQTPNQTPDQTPSPAPKN